MDDEQRRRMARIFLEMADLHGEIRDLYRRHGFTEAAQREQGQRIAYRRAAWMLEGRSDPAWELQWLRVFVQHEKDRLTQIGLPEADV